MGADKAVEILLNNASMHSELLTTVTLGNKVFGTERPQAPNPTWPPTTLSGPHLGRYAWKPHEVEIVARVARELRPGETPDYKRLVSLLGWDDLPEQARVYKSVRFQLFRVRAILEKGLDPINGQHRKTPDPRCTWLAWTRKVLAALPGGEGTVPEICAVIEADPEIAPLLDRRPVPDRRNDPIWRKMIAGSCKVRLGIVPTGERRNGYTVFRCDPQVASSGRATRVPKAGHQPGTSHLGKSKNSNVN